MWTLAGWLLIGSLALIVVSSWLNVSLHAGVAIAQDAMVSILFLAWAVLVIAILTREWLLAIPAGLLAVYHLFLLWPRLTANRLPKWVERAPRLQLLVANVFIDNETPGDLAQVLVAGDADVIIIDEWNPTFVGAFDAAGGRDGYPHRMFDPADDSDYAVGIVSRLPLLAESEVVRIGPLKFVRAIVEVADRPLTILGLNPMAAVDPGGFEIWEEQIGKLIDYVPSVVGPLVVAGDLNTTTTRPKVRELLATGLVDAHEAIGKGLSASFKLGARGVLASAGPVVRLDHALLNDELRALAAEDLASAGSDHLPFKLSVAVKPLDDRARRSRQRRPGGLELGRRRRRLEPGVAATGEEVAAHDHPDGPQRRDGDDELKQPDPALSDGEPRHRANPQQH
jgi:endonuclease/exonuclease/phosphatase (EEP) superfamily protein YafD